jgi:hypothetical protein
MEDNNTGAILLIVILGGLAVWWLLNRKSQAVAPPPAPCAVGVSYMGTGASIPCTAIGQGIKLAGQYVDLGKSLLSNPLGGNTDTTSAAFLQRLAIDANKRGLVAIRPKPGQFGIPTGPPLPPGAINVVFTNTSGRPELDVIQQYSLPGAPPGIISQSK